MTDREVWTSKLAEMIRKENSNPRAQEILRNFRFKGKRSTKLVKIEIKKPA